MLHQKRVKMHITSVDGISDLPIGGMERSDANVSAKITLLERYLRQSKRSLIMFRHRRWRYCSIVIRLEVLTVNNIV